METQIVNSSNIKTIGYDKEYFIMRVEFTNDSIYDYSPVPQEKYIALMSAESKGKYFNQHIKGDETLTVVKVTPKESEEVKNRQTKPLIIPQNKSHEEEK